MPDRLASGMAGHSVAISFVTVGELTKRTLIRNWGARRLAAVERFLSLVLVPSYSPHVAKRCDGLAYRRSA